MTHTCTITPYLSFLNDFFQSHLSDFIDQNEAWLKKKPCYKYCTEPHVVWNVLRYLNRDRYNAISHFCLGVWKMNTTFYIIC